MAVTSMANSSIRDYQKSNTLSNNGLFYEWEYVCLAGGGGGSGGGGGAGGYQSQIAGELSGGGAKVGPFIKFSAGDSFTVTVGAGGAGSSNSDTTKGTNGGNSVLDSVTSLGGGGAGAYATPDGLSGGSGGGGAGRNSGTGGSGTAGQGFDGGDGAGLVGSQPSGGGGGARTIGDDFLSDTEGGYGGYGFAPEVTSRPDVYTASALAGGGGGSNWAGIGTRGLGRDNAGNGQLGSSGSPAVSNSGGGGGGTNAGRIGGAGGSGLVILRYPNTYSLSVGAGLTSVTYTIGDKKYTVFTAGTGTVTVS